MERSLFNFGFVIVSMTLICYGWIYIDPIIAISGAVIYLIKMLFNIIDLITVARKFKKDGLSSHMKRNKFDTITKVIEGILVIVALFLVTSENDLYKTPACMIWFGQIVSYILVGPIVEIFAGVPMKSTYGGWVPKGLKK